MPDIENKMVLPYADDDPLPTPPEQDPDEAYEQQRSDELRKELERIARCQK